MVFLFTEKRQKNLVNKYSSIFCKHRAALSVTSSHAYFHSPAISWEIWQRNLNLIVFLLHETPDTSETWFWFWLQVFFPLYSFFSSSRFEFRATFKTSKNIWHDNFHFTSCQKKTQQKTVHMWDFYGMIALHTNNTVSWYFPLTFPKLSLVTPTETLDKILCEIWVGQGMVL